MNHHQDIDDGLEEFEASQEQRAAELKYREAPGTFNSYFEGSQFVGSRIDTLHLIGSKLRSKGHPFDFENGYASIKGVHEGKHKLLTIRWSNCGENAEITVRTLATK